MRVKIEASFCLLTPPAPGALAVLRLFGDVDAALAALHIAPVAVGGVALRALAGVDRGLVARISATAADLMPHSGPEVLRQLHAALIDIGLTPMQPAAVSPRQLYPEARTDIEAHALAAIARAASPLAIDLLLDQPRRWAAHTATDSDLAPAHVLNRLIDPPTVAAIGPANIGKSTLTNALAGTAVSAVADEPGTTRDHVGVMLDLGGLVVRFIDCPGLRPLDAGEQSAAEREAVEVALAAAAGADLVLACGDALAPPIALPAALASRPTLRIALRADLAIAAWAGPGVPRVAIPPAGVGSGVAELAAAIRQQLLPDAALHDPRPWRFWNAT